MKKTRTTSPVVERGRNHHRFVSRILKKIDAGYGASHEETIALADEVKDLRALLAESPRANDAPHVAPGSPPTIGRR